MPSISSGHIDMELSDYYETMPEQFQAVIPKTNPMLRDVIHAYNRSK